MRLAVRWRKPLGARLKGVCPPFLKSQRRIYLQYLIEITKRSRPQVFDGFRLGEDLPLFEQQFGSNASRLLSGVGIIIPEAVYHFALTANHMSIKAVSRQSSEG